MIIWIDKYKSFTKKSPVLHLSKLVTEHFQVHKNVPFSGQQQKRVTVPSYLHGYLSKYLLSELPDTCTSSFYRPQADLATDIKDFFAEALNVDEGRDYDIDAERIFVHPQYDPKSKVVLMYI